MKRALNKIDQHQIRQYRVCVEIEPRSTWVIQEQTTAARIEPMTLGGLGNLITITPVLRLCGDIFT